ncbi:MAG: translation initiation factor IF-2 [Cytophagales bacterium]|nr:MAG: translation initiation factor IF-2 [Cytophagales bacterium]
MTEEKMIRLSQAAKELNVGVQTLINNLADKGIKEITTNSKITVEQLESIAKELGIEIVSKKGDVGLAIPNQANKQENIKTAENKENKEITPTNTIKEEENITPPPIQEEEVVAVVAIETPTITNEAKTETEDKEENTEENKNKLRGIKVIGKIDLGKQESRKQIENKNIAEQNKKTNEARKQKHKEKTQEKTTPTEVKIEQESKEKIDTQINQKEDTQQNIKTTQEEPILNIIESTNTLIEVEGEVEDAVIRAKAETLSGLKILGKIELPTKNNAGKPVASSDEKSKKKRRRKKKRGENTQNTNNNTQNTTNNNNQNNTQNTNNNNNSNNNNQANRNNNSTNNTNNNNNNQANRSNTNSNTNNNNNNNNNKKKDKRKNPVVREEISAKQVQDKLKETLAIMSGGNNTPNKNKRKGDKRNRIQGEEEYNAANKILKITEFISVSELASLMDLTVNEVISKCLTLGMFVSINQRLDADAIIFIADEFGFTVEFTSIEDENKKEDSEEDNVENLVSRAPIVTVMGHVDHGKTSLLDHIRKANVTASEAGGITQHIGAYDVVTDTGKRVVFLDTPGHEAFTAMRARGTKVTDVVILVVAADDSVMPQTIEAINHAKGAGVPIVIAINKIDKPSADPERIKQQLAEHHVLVESWGGKYQDQPISAKSGLGIEELLDKVLLEAELLELKSNPNKKASGAVIEASLDKGKGYITSVLVQNGTLRIGDIMLAGSNYGRVKAMYDHRGNRIKEAGPSTPVQVLGLNGAPQAGDVIKVMESEREVKEIALKREQIARMQSIKAQEGFNLRNIRRKLALGDFQELKLIVKGDVDGSVEALSDQLQKLSNDEITVKIIHKAVGQISEADVNLAVASEAIIIGFQVRPSNNAKKIAENQKVEIKLYSIIYDAISEVKDAMEGMLSPVIEEEIVGNAEVREVFKISKVGTVAGCRVLDGYIKRVNHMRLIRDGIVVYEGELGALKRFKDDVNEVKSGFECGLSIKNFNDMKIGDVIESYEKRETKRTLE